MIKQIFNSVRNLFNSQISRFTGMRTILRNKFFGDTKFYCNNNIEAFRTIYYGDEETALGAFLFFLLEDDVVWDIGASVGLFSVYAANKTDKVISFEPDPEIRARLIENIELNKLSNKVIVRDNAIGDKDGDMQLHSDGVNGMSPSIAELKRHKNSITIPIRTMDSLLADDLIKPTVIKIDIEGAELMALRGGKELLSGTTKPRLLFMEVHPNFLKDMGSTDAELISLLKEYGYKIISTSWRDNQYHVLAVPS